MSTDSTAGHLLDYVRSASLLLDLNLDAAQMARVAAHLERTRLMAQALSGVALAPHDEPAAVFCPAPFPPKESS
jgi:hypothetical protein